MASIFKCEMGILYSELLSFSDSLEPPEPGIIQKYKMKFVSHFMNVYIGILISKTNPYSFKINYF